MVAGRNILPEYLQEWNALSPGKASLIDGQMFWRDDKKLYIEKKLVVPQKKLKEVIHWCHEINGHPGVERTLWFLLSQFQTKIPRNELQNLIQEIISPCQICVEAKPNVASDRGLVGALPIPLMVNEIIYVDFISMDEYNNLDYILTIVDGLSRFTQFVPTKKKIDGEGVLKLLFQNWIQPFGKPKEVYSDNDIRFFSPKGWWQSILKAINVKVNFATPRHPESNGLCERINCSFIQNMRILMMVKNTRIGSDLYLIVHGL